MIESCVVDSEFQEMFYGNDISIRFNYYKHYLSLSEVTIKISKKNISIDSLDEIFLKFDGDSYYIFSFDLKYFGEIIDLLNNKKKFSVGMTNYRAFNTIEKIFGSNDYAYFGGKFENFVNEVIENS